MIRRTRFPLGSRKLLLFAPAAGITMLVAACGGVTYGATTTPAAPGGADYGGGSYGSSGSPGTTAATSVAVRASGLGSILTDGGGRTVYLFEKDSGNTSACDSSCASVWPPLLADGGVHAGSGASGGLLATVTRADGTKQVSYNGHPLYYYVGDHAPGDTSGQNLTQFGGGWYVLSPLGTQIGN